MDGEAAVVDAVEPDIGSESEADYSAEDTQTEIAPAEGAEPESEPKAEIEGTEPLPKDITAALKELRRENPKVADALRKAYFGYGQLTESFPTAREAKAAKLAFESVGGVEGIATLREQVQASEYLEQAAEQGDSSIIDDWSQDYPQGFKSVMPYAAQKWAEMDPQGFTSAIQPHLIGFLERAQLTERLEEMWNAVGSDNKQAAQSLIQNIYNWLNAQREQARQNGQQAKHPAEERLAERENQVKQQEERLFIGGIGRETLAHQDASVEKALAPYLKGSKISPAARNRLTAAVKSDINASLTSDEGYQRQVKAFLAKRDAKGAASYIKGHLDTIIPSIARRAWQDLYGPVPKAAKAASLNTTNGQNRPQTPTGNEVRVARKPAMSEIEKNPGYMESYIAGKAIMAKGPLKGKMVRWKEAVRR